MGGGPFIPMSPIRNRTSTGASAPLVPDVDPPTYEFQLNGRADTRPRARGGATSTFGTWHDHGGHGTASRLQPKRRLLSPDSDRLTDFGAGRTAGKGKIWDNSDGPGRSDVSRSSASGRAIRADGADECISVRQRRMRPWRPADVVPLLARGGEEPHALGKRFVFHVSHYDCLRAAGTAVRWLGWRMYARDLEQNQ